MDKKTQLLFRCDLINLIREAEIDIKLKEKQNKKIDKEKNIVSWGMNQMAINDLKMRKTILDSLLNYFKLF